VQEFGAQFRRGIGEITFRKPIKKFGASVIVQPVLATRGRLANIEVVVGQPDSSFAQFRQQGPIAIQSYVEAIFKELLGLRRRLTKREDSQGADLRQDTKEEREIPPLWWVWCSPFPIPFRSLRAKYCREISAWSPQANPY